MAFERVTVDPEQMGGLPPHPQRARHCEHGPRAARGRGSTIEQVLADYPRSERADVLAALEYAAAVVNEREVPIARPA